MFFKAGSSPGPAADYVVARLVELLGVLLESPHALPRFARQALLPQAVLVAAGLSSLMAGRTKLTGATSSHAQGRELPAFCACGLGLLWSRVAFLDLSSLVAGGC